ncbi:MAG: NADP-dependent malic enzyme [Prevotellaceae bacterium]|jgi:malate dehydrogenase (oxaloacetate-decarboxylating)(NADP+)|nr:NADP-dependent malic enzyme [Prevotellaceae bacterium]
MSKIQKKAALSYHAEGRPGKIEVVPTKPYSTQVDLSLAYSPGVAEPCLAIADNAADAYKYTVKGNLVAVISNGTAVLGLGDIGAIAGKPVMEGKGLLFKIFADVDVFDIEIDTKDPEKFIETVKLISPTFGGINLEDIKAPECFEIEERLKKELDIPIMHDDQHGTAIISSAALLNAVEVAGKKLSDVRVVVNGAGASAIACSKLYISLGVKRENLTMLDSKGVLTAKRTDLNRMKKEFATTRSISTLEEAMKDADVFLGLSKGNILSREVIRLMAPNPIVFALANPTPEISYEEAMASRSDIIFATGRSDYPNQVNNVLGFPFIFRGALDVHAKSINEEMKIAAVKALAALAKEPVPDSVSSAYGNTRLAFGRDYLIPKPMDPRLISRISVAVAKAAIESGVARRNIDNWDVYSFELQRRMGRSSDFMNNMTIKAKEKPRRIVFPNGESIKVLQAAQTMLNDKLAQPVLLGSKEKIAQLCADGNLDLTGAEIIRFYGEEEKARRELYAQQLFNKRQRKGMPYQYAIKKMENNDMFGLMMVESGDADAMLTAFSSDYGKKLNTVRQVISAYEDDNHVAGMFIIMTKRGPLFLADCTIKSPDSTALVKTTELLYEAVKKFGIEPRIAMISYSSFGVVQEGSAKRVSRAVEMLHNKYPDMLVDGEIQANYAFNEKLRMEKFPFNKLRNLEVNCFVFPCLNSGNVVPLFVKELSGYELIGPLILGLEKPVHILPAECSVRDIINMVAITSTQTPFSSAN